MNLIRFTFANIFDFKSIIDSLTGRNEGFSAVTVFHASNSNKLQIVFRYALFTGPITDFVNSICAPTNIEELHE